MAGDTATDDTAAATGQTKAPMESRQFLYTKDTGSERVLHLEEDVLCSFLENAEVADKPVVVISVTGPFRTGKSFLLNCMTRYVTAEDKTRWLDNQLVSFPWRSGSKAHTNGMFMSSPIPVKLQSGEEAVLILLDTQGLFDDNSNMADAAKIFALSTLFSSVQVFNLKGNLKSDDLDHLQLFAEIGALAREHSDITPFQDLLFLIRDWDLIDTHSFGSGGGNALVKERLASDKEDLSKRRHHIQSSFTKVAGFLLPHPGKAAARSSELVDDMDDEFEHALNDLLATLLSPENLSAKMNGNRPVTCKHLAALIKTYTSLFKAGKIPEPKGILQTVAEGCNMAAVDAELMSYARKMNELLSADAPLLSEEMHTETHTREKSEALQSLKKRETIRDPTKSGNHYASLLEGMIEDRYLTSQPLFQEKCNQDKEKVKAKNESLVKECIQLFDAAMHPLENEVPVGETKIKEMYTRAEHEALERFEKEMVPLGSYIPTEFRAGLECTLEEKLRAILAKDEDMSNRALVHDHFLSYRGHMESLLDESAPNLDEGLVSNEHSRSKTEVMRALMLLTTRTYSTRSEDEYSCLLEDRIERWFQTSQDRFRKKCKHDKMKADEANSMLARECTTSFLTIIDTLSSAQPMEKRKLLDEYEKAKEETQQLFERRKIVFGSYHAEESKSKLLKVMDEELQRALKKGEEKSNTAVVSRLFLYYVERMESLFGEDVWAHDDLLASEHSERKTEVLSKLKDELSIEHSTKSEDDYQTMLELKISRWSEQARKRFKDKCRTDVCKADAVNSELVNKCVSSFLSHMDSLIEAQHPPKWKILETFKKDSESVRKHFEKEKVAFGPYNAAEHWQKLEKIMHDKLNVMLKNEEEKSNSATVHQHYRHYKARMEVFLKSNPLVHYGLIEHEHHEIRREVLSTLITQLHIEHSTMSAEDYHSQLSKHIDEWFQQSKGRFQQLCTRSREDARKKNKELAVECLEMFFTSVQKKLTQEKQRKLKEMFREERRKILQTFDKNKLVLGPYEAEDIRQRLEKVMLRLSEKMTTTEKTRRAKKAGKIVAMTIGALLAATTGPAAWFVEGALLTSLYATAAGVGITGVVLGAITIADSDPPEEARTKTFGYLMDERNDDEEVEEKAYVLVSLTAYQKKKSRRS